MLVLSPEQQSRATRLHRESLVVDSQSVFETSPLQTPRMLEVKRNAPSVGEGWRLVQEAADEAFRLGEYDEYWQWHREAGVDVVSVTLGLDAAAGKFDFDSAVVDCARWTWRFDRLSQYLKVTEAADLRHAHRTGRRGVILNFQNSTHIDGRLENLDFFHKLGVRVVGLAYNVDNDLAGGCTQHPSTGLTTCGVEAVKRMNDLGILVDASHASERTALDAIEHSRTPIAITHTACRALHEHDRGKSDEVLAAIGASKGYLGIVVVPTFLTTDPAPTLDHFLDHIDHAVQIAGVDCVGIGTDWSAGGYTSAVTTEEIALDPENDPDFQRKVIESNLALGFREEHLRNLFNRLDALRWWREWPNLTRGLVARGYADEEIRGLLGGNWLRVFETAVG